MSSAQLALPALGVVMTRPAGGYKVICMRCDKRISVVRLRSEGLAALDWHDADKHPAWREVAA